MIDAHPDLLNGEAILPAFRTDKSSLSDLVPSTGDPTTFGIDTARLEEHIAKVSGQIRRVMPWDLGDIANKFKAAVVEGIRNPRSLVRRELTRRNVPAATVERVANEIETLDLRNSVVLRDYISKLPADMRALFYNYATACYHRIGTTVVRCETGTDLSPLSEFKAADVVLAARDSEKPDLLDERIFLQAFMGHALGKIQTLLVPSQVIDSLSFRTAHQLSSALRSQGFQQKYDQITQQYLALATRGEDTFDALDVEAITSAVKELTKIFQREIVSELPDYKTALQSDKKDKVYQSTGDFLRDLAGSIPVIGNFVSWMALVISGTQAAGDLADLASVQNQRGAFEQAQQRKSEKIEVAIQNLKAGSQNKAKLLNATAALADIHTIASSRA